MSIVNATPIVRVITFIPVSGHDHSKQLVRVGDASKDVPDTWVSMRVRSQNMEFFHGDSTQLADGRSLSELTGEITLRSFPEGRSDFADDKGTRTVVGIIRHDSSGFDRPDYTVTLYLSIEELHRVAELVQIRRLAGIHVEFKASPIESAEDQLNDGAPGLHTGRLGRHGFYVWDHHNPLVIDSAKVEFDLDRAPGSAGPEDTAALSDGPRVRELIARAHKTLARIVVNYPQAKWAYDGVRGDYRGAKQEQPSADQIKQVSMTGAGQQLEALIRESCRHHISEAYQAASCAVEFIRANGIIYRARATQAASQKKSGKLEKPIVVPNHLPMWVAPSIGGNQEMDGMNSLEMVDRDQLVDICTQFFRSGVRCKWFEKMLVESLVGAEAYATLKVSKTEPSRWTGQAQFLRTMMATSAFDKSKGGAMYHLYMQFGNIALIAGQFAVFSGLCWWAYSKYQLNSDWRSVIGLVVLALVGFGWVGRYVTQLIVRWSRPFPTQTAAASLLSTPFGSALIALLQAYKAVSADATSITAAGDSIRAAMARDGAIDHIALAFLDRAQERKEFVWMRSGSGNLAELDDMGP
jgi:hypothetical protein